MTRKPDTQARAVTRHTLACTLLVWAMLTTPMLAFGLQFV